jgi:hypothetical protein
MTKIPIEKSAAGDIETLEARDAIHAAEKRNTWFTKAVLSPFPPPSGCDMVIC